MEKLVSVKVNVQIARSMLECAGFDMRNASEDEVFDNVLSLLEAYGTTFEHVNSRGVKMRDVMRDVLLLDAIEFLSLYSDYSVAMYKDIYMKAAHSLSFVTDYEKMRDFRELSKDEFLESFSYLTEEEYEATAVEYDYIKSCSVDDLNLSIRPYACLKKAGFGEVGDILNKIDFGSDTSYDFFVRCKRFSAPLD